MILLISDGGSCALRTALSNAGQKNAFLETTAPLFFRNLKSVLEDPSLEIAVIECMLHEHQCLALLKKIKQIRLDVPVIFVCSSDSSHIVTEAFQLGARYCFKKPVEVALLKEKIKVLRKLKSESRERRVAFRPDKTGASERACATTNVPDNILRVMNYIEDHVSDRSLGIVRLAKVAGMSPYHFCRVFKKHAVNTPMQFLSRIRVEKAKDLLQHDSANLSVYQIATCVGFCDSGNFNKHFKKTTGLTPTAFKRTAKPSP